MSSVASNASSVSFRGEEMGVDEALDELFVELQQNLNSCQCSIRNLAQSEERSETFMEAVGYHFEILDYIDILQNLFSELRGVSKQVVGSCPKEYREEYKALQEKRKTDKKRMKEEEKQAKQMEKMSLSAITE